MSPYPNVETEQWRISSGGGTRPVWSADGSEVFYYVDQGSSGVFMAVALEYNEPALTTGTPERLFEGPYFPPLGIVAESPSFYDVDDEGRFLIIKDIASDSDAERTQVAFVEPPQVIIVQNWVDELQRLVPTN